MSVISPLNCRLGRHEPIRRKVHWDGRNYTGNCKHCGKEIERVAHRNWRQRMSEAS